jgi:hypothetical protein
VEQGRMVVIMVVGMVIIWSLWYLAQCWKWLGLVQGTEESVCDDRSKMV